ncbi:hypothetical protein Ga0074812_108129 [Parafrankia irregularis]|uniref:Uncharacterized protein n=1 Tax=Parafrankia irregularis TaxID=795642 RepID=A0A0S4QN16_9ACTN|nr:hypothetical protein Ga0074812_108129 [Parafrankia irregularis]
MSWPRTGTGRPRTCSWVSSSRSSRSRRRGVSVSPPERQPRRGSSPRSSPVPSRRRPGQAVGCNAVLVIGAADSSLAFMAWHQRTESAGASLRTRVEARRRTWAPRGVQRICCLWTTRPPMIWLADSAVNLSACLVPRQRHQRRLGRVLGAQRDRAAVCTSVGAGAGRAAGLVGEGGVDLAGEDLVGLCDPHPGADEVRAGCSHTPTSTRAAPGTAPGTPRVCHSPPDQQHAPPPQTGHCRPGARAEGVASTMQHRSSKGCCAPQSPDAIAMRPAWGRRPTRNNTWTTFPLNYLTTSSDS